MGIVKRVGFALVHPFLRVYIKLRFGDYWGLKEHLQSHPSGMLKQAYEKYFMKYGSYVGIGSKIAGRPYFPHGCVGVFISNDAVIGKDAAPTPCRAPGAPAPPSSGTGYTSAWGPRSSAASPWVTAAGWGPTPWSIRICRPTRSPCAPPPGLFRRRTWTTPSE